MEFHRIAKYSLKTVHAMVAILLPYEDCELLIAAVVCWIIIHRYVGTVLLEELL